VYIYIKYLAQFDRKIILFLSMQVTTMVTLTNIREAIMTLKMPFSASRKTFSRKLLQGRTIKSVECEQNIYYLG